MSNQNKYPVSEAHDELRAKFTSWLLVVLRNARSNYLTTASRTIKAVSLDDCSMSMVADPCDHFYMVETSQSEFDFQEEKLATAYLKLPAARREILRLLFVEEKSPQEIAVQLHCSENVVYQQKHQAIKTLKKLLQEEE